MAFNPFSQGLISKEHKYVHIRREFSNQLALVPSHIAKSWMRKNKIIFSLFFADVLKFSEKQNLAFFQSSQGIPNFSKN